MLRVENNKILLNDKELEKLKKSSYDLGIVDGTKIAVGVILKKVMELELDNFEEKKKEIINFCMGVIKVEKEGVKNTNGKINND